MAFLVLPHVGQTDQMVGQSMGLGLVKLKILVAHLHTGHSHVIRCTCISATHVPVQRVPLGHEVLVGVEVGVGPHCLPHVLRRELHGAVVGPGRAPGHLVLGHGRPAQPPHLAAGGLVAVVLGATHGVHHHDGGLEAGLVIAV